MLRWHSQGARSKENPKGNSLAMPAFSAKRHRTARKNGRSLTTLRGVCVYVPREQLECRLRHHCVGCKQSVGSCQNKWDEQMGSYTIFGGSKIIGVKNKSEFRSAPKPRHSPQLNLLPVAPVAQIRAEAAYCGTSCLMNVAFATNGL